MDFGCQAIYVDLVEETIEASIVEETIEASIVEETIRVDVSNTETLTLEVVEAEEITATIESWSCPNVESGGGYIFITDVTTSGIAANKIYEDTIPADTVLSSVTVDSDACHVHFIAEGGIGYSPTVQIDGTVCTNLVEVSQDKRIFTGSIPVNITTTQPVTIISSTGQRDTVTITRADAAPSVLSCVIGDYPGSQTAAKDGDSIHVTGTVEESATYVRLVAYGAFYDSGWVACSGGTFDITGVVGAASGLQYARVFAKNALGSTGSTFDSANQITLDQAAPSFIDIGVTYPVGQSALKGTETATQRTRVLDYSTVTYSSPHGDISIENSGTYEENKTVQCLNPGDYNDSSINFRIVATKASNATSSTFTKTIEVADIAPTITVTQASTRLRSSPTGQAHIITATSDQNLSSAPGIGIPVSGTWLGAGFTIGPKVWVRTISISDSDIPGTGAWTLDTAPTNRAGISATTISGSQVVGGFVSRDITLPAFGTSIDLDAYVTDTSKLSFSWSFKAGMTFQPIGTAAPVVSGWTIDDTDINPTEIIILDTQAAASSSQESTIAIEEVA